MLLSRFPLPIAQQIFLWLSVEEAMLLCSTTCRDWRSICFHPSTFVILMASLENQRRIWQDHHSNDTMRRQVKLALKAKAAALQVDAAFPFHWFTPKSQKDILVSLTTRSSFLPARRRLRDRYHRTLSDRHHWSDCIVVVC
jgi:hypothetical protein